MKLPAFLNMSRRERERMVTTQIEARGVTDARVLEALRSVPRHDFVPANLQAESYRDHALPIDCEQTISQPYIVACMTELLKLHPGDKVLEIGTGSGYQAAVLFQITPDVFTIEIVPTLHETAGPRLVKLGFPPDHIRLGDGYSGWPEEAPFDAIIVTAAPDHVPAPLIAQLKPGGRMVIPVGTMGRNQELQVISKDAEGGLQVKDVFAVRFVPLTGKLGK